jgi:hypothetical protein
MIRLVLCYLLLLDMGTNIVHLSMPHSASIHVLDNNSQRQKNGKVTLSFIQSINQGGKIGEVILSVAWLELFL